MFPREVESMWEDNIKMQHRNALFECGQLGRDMPLG
jgi:hypothetical protein